MNTYTPKVGDRVRAANGESVIVGSVAGEGDGFGVLVDVDLRVGGALFYLHTGIWEFTQVVEPMVFKPLAVVQVAPGVAVRSVDDAWGNTSREFVRVTEGGWHQFGIPGGWLDDGEVEGLIRGGEAEVLFEGVAT